MGSYTDKLYARKRQGKLTILPDRYIVACAIRRDGIEHSGFQTHSDLRRELGDENYYKGLPRDEEGFMDNHGIFLNRRDAARVAYSAGQTHGNRGELLSCDVKWL